MGIDFKNREFGMYFLLDKPAVQKPAVVSQMAAVQHKAQPTKKHQQMLNIVQDNIISLKTELFSEFFIKQKEC